MKIQLAASGNWKIDGSDPKYYGDLYLNEDEGGIILYIKIPNDGPPKSLLELPLKMLFITGELINGAKITLVQCTRVSNQSNIGSEEVFGYSAKFMLEGVAFDNKEEIIFSKMKVHIPNIIYWGDVSNFVLPDVNQHDVFIGLNILEPIEIYSSDQYSIFYELVFNPLIVYPMQEEFTLKQMPFLIVETSSLHPLDWFIDKVSKMKSIIEIAIGKPLEFNTMVLESPNINLEFDDGSKRTRPVKTIHSLKNSKIDDYHFKEIDRLDYLFTLDELATHGDFQKWLEVSPVMEPIIELYIDDLYNKEVSISRHFLNMIQALETYHSRRASPDSYKQRVAKLLLKVPSRSKDQYSEFLLSGSRNGPLLKNRIADLILADFNHSFYTADIKFLDFPQTIADTRNYYTHYNPKKEEKALKGNDLANAYFILQNILEYYLLIEFGFDNEFIREKIGNRIRPLVHSREIREADQRKWMKD